MEIDIQKIKDDVAVKSGYRDFDHVVYTSERQSDSKCVHEVVDKIIFEVHKQTAEAQRVLCSNEYKKEKDGFWLGINDNISNCESPKIK